MILLKLFFAFLKIGAFTFGGGYAMIPLIQAEVVSAGWITEKELIDLVAVSEATPGPFAVNAATFIGIKCAGLLGGVCATLGVVLPSFVIILIVSRYYEKFKTSRLVCGLMSGLRPCVVALLAYAVHSVGIALFSGTGHGPGTVVNAEFWVLFTLLLLAFILAIRKIPPIVVIVICAVLGVVSGYVFNL